MRSRLRRSYLRYYFKIEYCARISFWRRECRLRWRCRFLVKVHPWNESYWSVNLSVDNFGKKIDRKFSNWQTIAVFLVLSCLGAVGTCSCFTNTSLLVPRPPRSAVAGDYWIRVRSSVRLSVRQLFRWVSIPRSNSNVLGRIESNLLQWKNIYWSCAPGYWFCCATKIGVVRLGQK